MLNFGTMFIFALLRWNRASRGNCCAQGGGKIEEEEEKEDRQLQLPRFKHLSGQGRP